MGVHNEDCGTGRQEEGIARSARKNVQEKINGAISRDTSVMVLARPKCEFDIVFAARGM